MDFTLQSRAGCENKSERVHSPCSAAISHKNIPSAPPTLTSVLSVLLALLLLSIICLPAPLIVGSRDLVYGETNCKDWEHSCWTSGCEHERKWTRQHKICFPIPILNTLLSGWCPWEKDDSEGMRSVGGLVSWWQKYISCCFPRVDVTFTPPNAIYLLSKELTGNKTNSIY